MAGTIYIRFFIYQTAIYGHKLKEINLSTLSRNQDVSRFFFLTMAFCGAGNKQVNEIKTATQKKNKNNKQTLEKWFCAGTELVLTDGKTQIREGPSHITH